ncbi:uncharacterized protein BJ212DRAFT_1296505 [Suillus subaureus]|uniref:Uncharacterized protein n=1 Tax=Suillus subaureus TaxID=48587 RepID=A0A9P7EIW7_9AGAM|nr:uncharacterized protein BJ212DRAFT_1296505 [Suillus subaureus]KAG1822441.1 hypothetical protein BJ212DRAFT_1296505 [Suillus subaureus]
MGQEVTLVLFGTARVKGSGDPQLAHLTIPSHKKDDPKKVKYKSQADTICGLDGLLYHNNTDILVFCAVKMFSITISWMANECTASTATWCSSALCNHQTSTTLINQVQIQQWHLMNHENVHQRSLSCSALFLLLTEQESLAKTSCQVLKPQSTIVSQEIYGNKGEGFNENLDAWLDGKVNLVDKDDPGYLCCSDQVFVGSVNACLDSPKPPVLLSGRAMEMEAQNQL